MDWPICNDCQEARCRTKGWLVGGELRRFDARCNSCHRKYLRSLRGLSPGVASIPLSPEERIESNKRRNRRLELRRRPWLANRKDHCEQCGFVAQHECQLDVDHIDGNRRNNEPSNLQTLCANCHRLKTQQSKDFMGLVYKQTEQGKEEGQATEIKSLCDPVGEGAPMGAGALLASASSRNF